LPQLAGWISQAGILIALHIGGTVVSQQNYSLKGLERMHEINFSFNNLEYDQHECDSVMEGDWIIFRCRICPDYERRINTVTGETEVKNDSTIVRHTGRHIHSSPGDYKMLMN
jgi:hypothetical protein